MMNNFNNLSTILQIVASIVAILTFISKVASWIFPTVKDLVKRFPYLAQIMWVLLLFSGGYALGAFVSSRILPPHWNSMQLSVFDFENPSDANDWHMDDLQSDGSLGQTKDASMTVVSDRAFTGSSSLEVKRTVALSPQQETPLWIVWHVNDNVGSPSLLVGHIYFPNQSSYMIKYAQVCIETDKYGWSECVAFTPEEGNWNRFAVDLQHIYFRNTVTRAIEQIGLNGSHIRDFIIQGSILGGQVSLAPYSFNIDDIEIYTGFDRGDK